MKTKEIETKQEATALASSLGKTFRGWLFVPCQKQIDRATHQEYLSFRRSCIRVKMGEIDERRKNTKLTESDEEEYKRLKALEQEYREAGMLDKVKPQPIRFWCIRAQNKETNQRYYLYTWDKRPLWLKRAELRMRAKDDNRG